MLRYITIIMTALIVSTQPSVADINVNELAIKYPQCQDSGYRHECFEDFLSKDESYRKAGYFRDNLMWEGLIWEDDKLAFEYSEGVRTAADTCRKARTWYHCPNGDKQKPLEGGYLVFNKELNINSTEGKWTYHHARGDVFEGNYKNNLKDGFGKLTWVGGDIYEGNWKNDARNGYGKNTWVSGNVFEGNYKNNAREGLGKMTWVSGNVFEGIYKHGKRHYGKLTFAAGNTYNGAMHPKSGKFHGTGIMIWKSGNIYDGNWQNGKMHGKGKMIWKNGAIYDGNWKDGKRD